MGAHTGCAWRKASDKHTRSAGRNRGAVIKRAPDSPEHGRGGAVAHEPRRDAPGPVVVPVHGGHDKQGDEIALGGKDGHDCMSGSLPRMLHDFGFRGSASVEAAALGGAAHLVNFDGTDNIPAMRLLVEHYGAKNPGASVPAAEHSTITPWGQEREAEAYRHILERYPEGTVSVVSDSWDIVNACRNVWGGKLGDEINANPAAAW